MGMYRYYCIIAVATSFYVSLFLYLSPACRESVGRVLEAHDNRHVPAPADAAYAVRDRVGLRGRVVAAALLGKSAQGDPAGLPPRRRHLEAGQECLRGAGPRS